MDKIKSGQKWTKVDKSGQNPNKNLQNTTISCKVANSNKICLMN